MTWSIKIDSDDDGDFSDEDELPADLGSIDESLNGDETCKFTLPNDPEYQALLAADHLVEIQYDATTIWVGVCTGGTFSQDSIDVICYNKVWEEAARTLFGDPDTAQGDYSAGATDTTMMADVVLEDPHSEWQVGSTSAKSRGVYFDKATVIDTIWYIGQFTNQDYWTGDEHSRGTNINTINFGSRGDPGSPRDIETISISNHTVDRSLQRTYGIGISYESDGTRIIGEYGSGGYEIAYREGVRSLTDTALVDIVTKRVTSQNTDTTGTTVTVVIDDGFDLYPGDYVTMDFDELKLPSATYRVIKTHKMTATVDLEVDRAYSTISEMFRDLQRLADMGIYPVEGGGVAGHANMDWTTDLLFEWGPDSHDDVVWHTGSVNFNDASSLTIKDHDDVTATYIDEGIGLVTGVWYLYWEWGVDSLRATQTKTDAVSDESAIICKITVYSDASVRCKIEPVYSTSISPNTKLFDYTSGGIIVRDVLGDLKGVLDWTQYTENSVSTDTLLLETFGAVQIALLASAYGFHIHGTGTEYEGEMDMVGGVVVDFAQDEDDATAAHLVIPVRDTHPTDKYRNGLIWMIA